MGLFKIQLSLLLIIYIQYQIVISSDTQPRYNGNPNECLRSTAGFEYRGIKRITRSGYICQEWQQQHPSAHTFINPKMFGVKDISEVRNYCRNPNNATVGPWCFISNYPNGPRWEECAIPQCVRKDTDVEDPGDQPGVDKIIKSAAEYTTDWDQLGCFDPSCFPEVPAVTEVGCSATCAQSWTCTKYERECSSRPGNKIEVCMEKLAMCKRRVSPGKPCQAGFTTTTKYYYDHSTRTCQTFAYMGCGGNGNMFDTEDECLGKCNNWQCFLPVDVGVPVCPAGIEKRRGQRWAYHFALKQCVAFYYFGCGGNKNHFWSREACLKVCKSKITYKGGIQTPAVDLTGVAASLSR